MSIRNYSSIVLAEEIVNYCINNKKFIFISGNGASGKTELSKILYSVAVKHGRVNLISTDDFVVDTKLRESSNISWKDSNNLEYTGRYTTSIKESYFLQNLKAIIFNLENNNNYYHWPKKAKTNKECVLLCGNSVLNIIEGVGTVFLDKNKEDSISIFIECSKEVEINRRIGRKNSRYEKNADEVYNKFDVRNSQFRTYIKPHIVDYDIVLESLEDFSFDLIRDNLNIFK